MKNFVSKIFKRSLGNFPKTVKQALKLHVIVFCWVKHCGQGKKKGSVKKSFTIKFLQFLSLKYKTVDIDRLVEQQ